MSTEYVSMRFVSVKKLKFHCKANLREGGPCTGVIEGTPDEILNNKDHKFVMKCPKCGCELSGGRRWHLMSDQVKGICEFVRTVVNSSALFDLELLYDNSPPAKPAEPEPVPSADSSL